MGAHRVSLKQLLKIGTEVLSTTAQTLSGAINEVRANAALAYSAATSAYNKAGDALSAADAADNLAEDAYVRAGLVERPVSAAGAYIIGHATSEILTSFGTDTADTYGLRVTYAGSCKCWAFGNGTNPSAVTKTLFKVRLRSGQTYYASFKDGSSYLGVSFNIRNLNAGGQPIIATFTNSKSYGTFIAPTNGSNRSVQVSVEIVFPAQFDYPGPPMNCMPIIMTEDVDDPIESLADWNTIGAVASLPTLREDLGKLKTHLAALTNPATFAAAGTAFTMLGTVVRHQTGADPILMVTCFIQNPALEAIVKRNSFQVTGVQIVYYRNGVSNDSNIENAFVESYAYDAANHSVSITTEVSDSAYAGTVDGSPALILAQW